MRKRAKLFVIAVCLLVRIQILRTKLGLVLVRVIEFFHPIVRFVTIVPTRTVTSPFSPPHFLISVPILLGSCRDVGANLGLVISKGPPSIFVVIVIIGTSFHVVRLEVHLARDHLEVVQV